MEIKYIQTLNHIKRCNEIDGLDISEPPLELTAAKYRASCRWLKDNDYIYAAFVEGGGIETAKLKDAGQATLDDYHDELMERMKRFATDFELGNLGTLVLGDIDANIFCREPDSMEKIEVLEGILRIAEAKVPAMAVKQYTHELLNQIDKVGEYSSSEDLSFNAFVNLVKIYTVLRFRFREDGHYCTYVYPALKEAMDDIRTKPETILGKYKEKLSSLYKRFFRNPEEIHSYIDNLEPHFDEDKVAESITDSNIQAEDNNIHSDEEYQALLNKIQELEAENKRLKEENAELGQKLKEQEECLVEESKESDEDRMLILGELKENIYPAEIRSYIVAELFRLILEGKINETYKAAILIRNTTCFGTPASLQNTKMKGAEVFDAGRYFDICAEVNCLLRYIGIDIRIPCKYKNSDKVLTPVANWDVIKVKYPRHEKKRPNTP